MDQGSFRGDQPKLLILSVGIASHQAALRAALRAEYGLDLREVIEQRTMRCSDLGDLVVWLPAGSVFWRSVGGPASISPMERELREVSFWLRVLDYRERGSKGERPQRTPEPQWATDEKVQQSAESRKMAAYMARQKAKPHA